MLDERQCFYCKEQIPENDVMHAALVTEQPICNDCAEEVGCACMCFDVDEKYERVIITKEVKPIIKEITHSTFVFERVYKVYPETIRKG